MAFKHIYMLDNNLNQQKNEENDNYVLVSGQFFFALSNCMDWRCLINGDVESWG